MWGTDSVQLALRICQHAFQKNDWANFSIYVFYMWGHRKKRVHHILMDDLKDTASMQTVYLTRSSDD